MNEFYVYAYFEVGQENPFYIGKGKDNRCNWHIYACNDLTNITHFYNKLRKILKSSFPIIRKLYENLTEEQANDLEIKLIAQIGRLDLGTGPLCNHTDGGDGQTGYKHTEETKRKIGLAHLGEEVSIDTRIKMSNVRRNKKHTMQQKHKIAKSIIKTKGIPICSYNLITNQIIKKYTHINAVKQDGFIYQSVQRVVNGKQNNHAGMGWRHLLASEIEGE